MNGMCINVSVMDHRATPDEMLCGHCWTASSYQGQMANTTASSTRLSGRICRRFLPAIPWEDFQRQSSLWFSIVYSRLWTTSTMNVASSIQVSPPISSLDFVPESLTRVCLDIKSDNPGWTRTVRVYLVGNLYPRPRIRSKGERRTWLSKETFVVLRRSSVSRPQAY